MVAGVMARIQSTADVGVAVPNAGEDAQHPAQAKRVVEAIRLFLR